MSKNVYTVEQFAKEKRLAPEYVRLCCGGWKNPDSGRVYRLPPGWTARKVGGKFRGTWLIENDETAGTENIADGRSTISRDRFIRDQMLLMGPLLHSELPEDDAKVKAALADFVTGLLSRLSEQELAGHVAARWGVGSSASVQEPAEFFKMLSQHYRYAVDGGSDVDVELTFRPDGDWLVNGGKMAVRDFSQAQANAISLPDGYQPGSLEHLFMLTWVHVTQFKRQQISDPSLFAKGDRYLDAVWLKNPIVQSHAFRDDLINRCVFCAKQLQSKRRDVRFCQKPERCGPAFWSWIRFLASESDDEVRYRLDLRMRIIFPKHSRPTSM